MARRGGGGGGTQQSFTRGGSARGPSPYPAIYLFCWKRYPFRIPSIENYPFHIPKERLFLNFSLWMNQPSGASLGDNFESPF